ncbi:hypothetical protein [Neisseria zoodegmatis]|uniref:hypothetical protein n=1 Tax=Neisseria zoodegmatis TaxID=326523 RepID=UPI0011C07592|nr:hypothetical protein [Neisseria zoodegmatis]
MLKSNGKAGFALFLHAWCIRYEAFSRQYLSRFHIGCGFGLRPSEIPAQAFSDGLFLYHL